MPPLPDWLTNIGGFGAGGVLLFLIGKYILPILNNMLRNVADTTRAGGETLANVQKDRDEGYRQAKEARDEIATMQDRYDRIIKEQHDTYLTLQKDWVDMKSRFSLLLYQIKQQNSMLAAAGLKPLDINDTDSDNDKPH